MASLGASCGAVVGGQAGAHSLALWRGRALAHMRLQHGNLLECCVTQSLHTFVACGLGQQLPLLGAEGDSGFADPKRWAAVKGPLVATKAQVAQAQ